MSRKEELEEEIAECKSTISFWNIRIGELEDENMDNDKNDEIDMAMDEIEDTEFDINKLEIELKELEN